MIVAPRELLLNDSDKRAAFGIFDDFARGESGGIFPGMISMSLSTVACFGARLAYSAPEQTDHEVSLILADVD